METKKKLSFWHIWALGVGAVVGDGIFLMVAQAGQAAGPAATVAYFLGRSPNHAHLHVRL